ncbi:hypothetical protein [Sphingomonas mali]|uniref:hypothetical protein n=1 Tax=Sphingomonas mali TaxID=40682 RepID=UPI000A7EE958|nr:hypothetical protein [Sphingomonas mali]
MWTAGYSREELDRAQEEFDLIFPSDLVDLLRDRRPAEGYDWRIDHEKIREMLAWPLEGILFDIEQNGFWLSEWGSRSEVEEERREIATVEVGKAPKLIPLVSHRYLPAEPNEPGNPVFSIYQTDIIHYGANLEHYFRNEFGSWSSLEDSAYRHIRFWSDLAG